MNFIEFIDLPQKEKNKIYRSKMITSFGAFSVDQNKFFEICNIDKDDDWKINYWFSCKRSGYIEIFVHATYKNVPIDFVINVIKPTKTYVTIYSACVQRIYKEVCDIYDKRPDYNNLEYSVSNRTLQSIYERIGNFQEYCDYYVNEYHKIKKVCEEVAELYRTDKYENIVNEFLPIKYERGAGVIHPSHEGAIDFENLVNAFINFKHNFGDKYSFSDIAKCYYYAHKSIKSDKAYYDYWYSITQSPFEAYINGNVDINEDKIITILKSFDNDKNKKSYAEYLYKANCEYYLLVKEVKEHIANKYGIDKKELWALFKPEDGPEHFIHNEVPEKFKNEYK